MSDNRNSSFTACNHSKILALVALYFRNSHDTF